MPAGSPAASSTTKPARQLSPPQIPNATVNGSPRSIGPVARAQQSEACPLAGRQHEVARQRRPVPAQEADRLALAHPGAQAAQQAEHAVARSGRPTYSKAASWSTSLMTRKPVAGVDQQVRWRSRRGRSTRTSSRSASTRYAGTSSRRPLRVRSSSPTTPTREPAPTPSSARISASGRERSRGWPGRLRSWKQLTAHRQRRGAGHARSTRCRRGSPGRLAPDDQDGLLEAWVESGQEREVGAVLAIGVDHEPVVASRVHPLAEVRQPRGVQAVGDARLLRRHPEVGQVDVRKARRGSREFGRASPVVTAPTARSGRCPA